MPCSERLRLAAGRAACTPRAPPYTTTATIKEIMQLIVDPAADEVWLAVTTVDSAEGTVETVPRNDEDWLKAPAGRHHADRSPQPADDAGATRRPAPARSPRSPGVELEPAEMQANIAKDLPEFHKAALGLHNAAVQALAAIDAKDPQKLFELGETIERACEHCHSRYWYPNEKIPVFPTRPWRRPPLRTVVRRGSVVAEETFHLRATPRNGIRGHDAPDGFRWVRG